MSDQPVTQAPDAPGRQEILFARAKASQSRAGQLHLLAAQAVSNSQARRSQLPARFGGAADFPKSLLQASRYARLMARLASLPTIEQAKGILMAQTGCSPDAAFDMLRRASQRSNVPVKQLADRIVRNASKASDAQPQESDSGR